VSSAAQLLLNAGSFDLFEKTVRRIMAQVNIRDKGRK
jgi:hypothetical protein